MNCIITLNIQTDSSLEELNDMDISKPLIMDGKEAHIIGVDAVTPWDNNSNRIKELENISNAIKHHKEKLNF